MCTIINCKTAGGAQVGCMEEGSDPIGRDGRHDKIWERTRRQTTKEGAFPNILELLWSKVAAVAAVQSLLFLTCK